MKNQNFNKKLEEILRVDHAGELGAKVIYDGQIAALKLKGDQETLELVKKMKLQEDQHFDYFDTEVRKNKIRPTVMQPIWKVGGFAMGFLTAFAGKKVAMTCTVAVEEVIDSHYQEQISYLEQERDLNENEAQKVVELKSKIDKFREEELEHRDIGYEHHAADLPCFGALSKAIKLTTKFAIAVSKRV